MTRNRSSARAAGARFERAVADYVRDHVSEFIDRRVKTGANDKGDIVGVRAHGQRVVLECKDYGGRVLLGPWLREVDIERGNDDALVGALVIKRRATTDPGDQVVAMTLRDLVALLDRTTPVTIPAIISTAPDWMLRAACTNLNGDLFFPRKGDPTGSAKKAKEICAACPVAAQCLAYALAYEDGTGTAYRAGVYGGVTAYERRRLTNPSYRSAT